MPKRERKIPIQVYLSEDEDYILTQKQKASGLKSKSSFLRHLILYGYVYDIDYSELQEYNAALAKTTRKSLVETEHQLKDFGQILKYAEQYSANRIYHIRYQKSKDKDRYLRQHETELLLHDGAENMLKRFGIDTKNLDVEKLRSDYNALYSKKQALQKTYKTAEKESADLNRKLDNLNQYLDRPPEQAAVDKKVEKNQNTL